MLARFFIDRPILAWVISIVIVVMGMIAYKFLPVAQYPQITPPVVRVTAIYPGASAPVVATTVAAPIEQQINGVEGMLYMSSQSSNDGSYSLDVTFELGTDLNIAQVLVQNRVAIAQPQLPDVVKATGVTVKKRSPDILLVVNLVSEDDPATGKPYFDRLYLSNFATIQLLDPLARLEGVGDVFTFGGQDYSMRVWLDPDKLSARNISAADVAAVMREQNIQVAAGQIGQAPVPKGQEFQYSVNALGRLTEAEQFGNIILNTGTNGEVLYIRDVGRVELGAKSEDQTLALDGRPSIGLAIFQLPGSNALDTADGIKAKMREFEQANRFPKGLKYSIVYDTTPFIRESVDEVIRTLVIAVLLVAFVVLLFLQDWKSLLLPLIDIGVSLVGTFAVMKLMGFSLNNLTLFGLVLAIGIVVDDSIVVLENIERWLDKGLPVREATIKSMSEITGPILAITLVLSSVFLPSAFLSGITGQFFRQFALTISAAMIISAVNAMTMTPARAASIFANRKPGQHGDQGKEAFPWWGFGILGGLLALWLLKPIIGPHLGLVSAHGDTGEAAPIGFMGQAKQYTALLAIFIPGLIAGGALGWFIIGPVNLFLGRVFHGFNSLFEWITKMYGRAVAVFLRISVIALLLYVGLLALTGFGMTRVPGGFIPSQDKGRLIVNVQLPDSASLERTEEVMRRIEKIALETPGVAHTLGNPGRSFVLNAIGSNLGSMFVTLKDFDERRDPKMYADVIAGILRKRFREEIPGALINVFGAPAVDGLGNAGGFKMMVETIGDANYQRLQGQTDNLVAKGSKQPGLVGLFDGFRSETPQLYADVDRVQCKTMGVSLTDVFATLQVYLGGLYVNDFNRFGRTWQVNIQADAIFRNNVEAAKQLKVRNANGDMVPLGSVVNFRETTGPLTVTRYNMFPAATLAGGSLPGVSTGDVLSTMEGLANQELPRNMTYEWTELSYLQKQSAKLESFKDLQQNPYSAFVLGAVLVFFVLAGLYESWSLPMAVILVVPLCLSSALAGVMIAKMDLNIFVQVGFVVLVGLAAKNAILVVEFARDREMEGANSFDAAVEAATVRLRPIIMTSFAFVLGMLPLVIAHGAGAEMRRTLGTAVFAGMLGVTFFGIFLTPVFYYVVRRLAGPLTKPPSPEQEDESKKAEPHEGDKKPEALKDQETKPEGNPHPEAKPEESKHS
ncbi:efflux RND transporter permease subunit [Zavarzinella formosa]|uniref:efflux RND transporter permease subunit n=1 Tax=Zavarzinella formosa TaxID=360055 RepID=UPI0002F85A56|nr:efflux RND transporter permease subunit [Zavarzinella formosa]